MSLVLVLLLLGVVCHGVNGAVVSGSVSSGSFGFIGKFCFSDDPSGAAVGTIDLQVSTSIESVYANNNTYVALYDDQPDSWELAYHNKNGITCQEKLFLNVSKSSQLVQFNRATGVWSSGVIKIEQKLRPRFWYLAVVNCEGGYSNVNYNIHFLNVEFSNWDTEFGADEKGLNTLYLVYFFIYVFFIAVHLYGVKLMYNKLSYLHPLVKLCAVVILIEFVGVFLGMLHYGVFSKDGVGIPALLKLSAILLIISRLLFIALLLLLARGWTISSHDVTGKWPIILTIAVFTIIHIVTLLYTYVIQDPAETDVPYTQFVLLNMLIAVYVVLASIFFFFVIRSYVGEEHGLKKDLYLKLCFVFGLWFLLPPLTDWGVYALEDWQRTKVIAAIDLTVTTVGYMLMSFLLWPSRAEEYFYVATPSMENTDVGYDPLLM